MKTKWCCRWLDNMVEAAGSSGFSVVAYRNNDTDEKYFVLQYRATSMNNCELLSRKLSDGDYSTAIPRIVVCNQRISYCPVCGRRLSKFITKNIDVFDDLVNAHLPYV